MKTLDAKEKIILDLCGGTGSWSKPYGVAGYDVRLVTLPDNDVLTYEPPENVYGILAAPPCTEFSIAKGGSPRDFEAALQVVDACLKIIWKCRCSGNMRFWAMENPVGFLRQFLGVPIFTFEHWQYDSRSPFIKPTDVWGYFKPPVQTNTIKPKLEICSAHGKLYGNPQVPKEYEEYINKFGTYAARRAAIRAITPAGFANAFFRANK